MSPVVRGAESRTKQAPVKCWSHLASVHGTPVTQDLERRWPNERGLWAQV
jgi:hypothetical protein